MSDINVNFSLNYSPNPVGVDLNLKISNTTVSISLSGVPAVAVTASPRFSGSILDAAVSALATPLANAVTLSLGAFAGNLVNGLSFDVATVPNIPFNIQGVSGTIKPSSLSLSDFNGQLKIAGDVQVS